MEWEQEGSRSIDRIAASLMRLDSLGWTPDSANVIDEETDELLRYANILKGHAARFKLWLETEGLQDR